MNVLKADRINYLNIGLMLITAVLAYYFPFETFLWPMLTSGRCIT